MVDHSLREQGITLLREHIKNENLVRHCLAVEALMKALARKFGEDEALWGLTGLLHDMDWEETQNDFHRHSMVAADILAQEGFPSEVVNAVRVHNYVHGIEPKTLLEKALYATEEITGLIVAAVLVLPSRKLADLKAESIVNRMKEKSFARGVNRDIINLTPGYLGISIEELAGIALQAMQGIHETLGL